MNIKTNPITRIHQAIKHQYQKIVPDILILGSAIVIGLIITGLFFYLVIIPGMYPLINELMSLNWPNNQHFNAKSYTFLRYCP